MQQLHILFRSFFCSSSRMPIHMNLGNAEENSWKSIKIVCAEIHVFIGRPDNGHANGNALDVDTGGSGHTLKSAAILTLRATVSLVHAFNTSQGENIKPLRLCSRSTHVVI